MVPVIVLVVSAAVFRLVGALGVDALDGWNPAIRGGLASMLVLTASAHFTRRRSDLVAMVPPRLPRPGLLVTLTGLLELAIAAVLVFEETAGPAGVALAVLLVLLFPANARAAREGIRIGGRPPTPLGIRAAIQALFVAAAVAVA